MFKTTIKKYISKLLYMSLIPITSSIIASSLHDINFNYSHKVGVYIGSFDPLHKGHEAIINMVLDQYCDYVIVVADDYVNPKKPHRTAYHIRQKMLRAAFANQPRVIICDINQEQLLHYLRPKNVQLYGILGSDCAFEQTVSDFIAPHWIIVPRKEHEQHLQGMQTLSGSPVIIAPFYSVDISSTLIKQKIQQGLPIDNYELSPAVMQVIIEHQLYRS